MREEAEEEIVGTLAKIIDETNAAGLEKITIDDCTEDNILEGLGTPASNQRNVIDKMWNGTANLDDVLLVFED